MGMLWELYKPDGFLVCVTIPCIRNSEPCLFTGWDHIIDLHFWLLWRQLVYLLVGSEKT